MKRPEGFDRPETPKAPASAGRAGSKDRVPRPRREQPDPRPSARAPRAARPAPAPKAARPPKDTSARDARREAAAARAEARRAAAERRRYERAEIRRFTRRQRARRIAVVVTLSVVGLVIALVLIAVFSPILALRRVTVDGAARVDPAAVEAKLDEQLGTPLALVDYGRIDAALRQFPVIQSYTTETIPPDTIAIHIVERQPVVSVAKPGGGYLFVDSAGIAVQESADRLPGVPLVTESGTDIPNAAFDAAVEVLLAMPADLRAQVDTITAKSRDDVSLTLAGVTQGVKWGSADDSEIKAKLLEALRAQFGGQPGTFDVSAISTGIFKPAG